jgi:tRNA(adenine34) deaminase
MDHETLMRHALDEARRGAVAGEVPIGALLVVEGEVVSRGFNQPIASRDPTAHAEVVALRAGAKALSNYRLPGSTLYVTLEPCLLCVGAIVQARVSTLVYGASDPKGGAVRSILRAADLPLNHRFEVVEGVLAEECGRLLQDFFKARRGG